MQNGHFMYPKIVIAFNH